MNKKFTNDRSKLFDMTNEINVRNFYTYHFDLGYSTPVLFKNSEKGQGIGQLYVKVKVNSINIGYPPALALSHPASMGVNCLAFQYFSFRTKKTVRMRYYYYKM